MALVSSGDVGIYAMASPALELAGEDVDGVVIPGVTAAQAAASLLGSPLGHDHCSVSLSDLLTPWSVIQDRVRAAAEGDFVVSLYNPRSKGRDWQLSESEGDPARSPSTRHARRHSEGRLPPDAAGHPHRPRFSAPGGCGHAHHRPRRELPDQGGGRPHGYPEGILPVKAVFAVTEACAGCGACLKTCPEKAIRPDPRDYGAPSSSSKTAVRDAPSAPRSARSRRASRCCWRPNETRPSHRDRELPYPARDGRPLALEALSRAVAERVIHASADLDYAESLILDEAALESGISALRQGVPVVTDVGMVAAGITGRQTLCFVSDLRARRCPNSSA